MAYFHKHARKKLKKTVFHVFNLFNWLRSSITPINFNVNTTKVIIITRLLYFFMFVLFCLIIKINKKLIILTNNLFTLLAIYTYYVGYMYTLILLGDTQISYIIIKRSKSSNVFIKNSVRSIYKVYVKVIFRCQLNKKKTKPHLCLYFVNLFIIIR